MTPAQLLERFPYDPARRGQFELYKLPMKLTAIDDERLRELAATAWLATTEGKTWVKSLEYADNPYDPDERYP